MLRDKLKEWEQEMPEGLHEQLGGCRFCGQTKLLHTAMLWDEENCNEAATEMCDCAEAKDYANGKRREENAVKAISTAYGDTAPVPLPQFVSLLQPAVKPLVTGKIDSITVEVDGIKAKLSMTSKGKVKLSKTATDKAAVEV